MPQGKVRVINVVPIEPSNSVACRAQLICEDEDGVQWTFTTTYFNQDLKPYAVNQGLEYREWCNAVRARDTAWTRIDWHKLDLEPDYRAGLSPQQCYEKHYAARKS